MKLIKQNYWLVIIFFVGLAIRLYAAYMDPFLHDWDERFHALVARNLMNNFLEPVLIKNTVVAFNPIDWSAYNIWLHKQPLFLWQMALSMKIFGVSEFTLRLPSAIMGSIMILLIYRIAFILTKNKLTSLLSALLLCFSNYQLQLISGIEGMDHNDIAFEFYMLASCWAYAEYIETKKWYWAIVIGIFSGCAILNKWLIGLAVFLGWGINFLIQFYKSKSIKELKWMLISLIVCCVIFIPWQLYIFYHWPKEALFEMQFNSRHITEVLEGHWGTAKLLF
jgi:4-amino-4-deoxy-L-arabinose transferase